MNRILVIATLVLGMGALVAADAAAGPRGKKGKRASRPKVGRTTRPAPKPVVRHMPKPVVRPTPKRVVRPALKPVVRPAPKPVVRPTPRPVVKPVYKPVIRPAPAPRVNYYVAQRRKDLAQARSLETQAAALAGKAQEYEQARATALAKARILHKLANRAAMNRRGHRTQTAVHYQVQNLIRRANALYGQATNLAAARDYALARARTLTARAQALRAKHVVRTTRDFTWRTR